MLREFHFLTVVVRLALAMTAGGLIGYGRARKHRNAGMRTYMLVCTGAALTMLIAMYEREMLYGQWAWASAFTDIKFDASRFSAQVINGVGFLAAGTIIGVAHQQVSGLTTAIGLFVTAGLGIASGSGFYEGVLIATPLVMVAMELLTPVELIYKRRLRNIMISVEFGDITDMEVITETVAECGAKLFELDIERAEAKDGQFPSAILTLKMARGQASHSAMLSSLAELSCVRSVRELIS